jgi:transposase
MGPAEAAPAEVRAPWRPLGQPPRDHQRILYRNRTGAPWRDLPARFGKWKTVYERHRRWSADGTWDSLFAAVLADADAEGHIDWSMVSMDSTSCRAHQHAAGGRKKPPATAGKRRHAPGSTAPTRDSDAPGAVRRAVPKQVTPDRQGRLRGGTRGRLGVWSATAPASRGCQGVRPGPRAGRCRLVVRRAAVRRQALHAGR